MNPASPAESSLRTVSLKQGLILSLLCLSLNAPVFGQAVSQPAPTAEEPKASALTAEDAKKEAAKAKENSPQEEVIVMSPFEVSSSSDVGYEARDTLNGGRLNTSLNDIASQVQVMTPEFMKDLALTDLSDAIAYSLNTENAAEFYDNSAVNTAGNDGSIQAFSGSPRTRGLAGTTIGRDFFQSRMPVDTYNSERITFASGANNTLFGNASPGGSIDTSPKRARTNKRTVSLSYRVDDNGSERSIADINQPLIPGKAAIRWVGLRDRSNDFREPSYADQDRSFVTLTVTPYRWVSARAWYEDYKSHNQPVRNTLLKDRVSAWIAAGKPAFDNSLSLTTAAAATAATPWIRQPTGRTQPYYVMDGGEAVGIRRMVNTASTNFGTVQSVGQAQLGAVPDNFDWSQIDPNLAPIDIAFAGNAVQNRRAGRNYGFVLNFNPIKNLYIEYGQSYELYKHRYVDLYRNSELNLFVDANKWAVDQTGALVKDSTGANVPNPYFGRYYMDDIFATAGLTLSQFNQSRLAATYQLDFTGKDGWMKWFGRHNLTGLYDHLIDDNTGGGQTFAPTAISPVTGGPTGTGSTVFFRYYLPDASHPGSYPINLPFDPIQPGVIDLPNSGGVQLRGYDAPQGAAGATFPGRRIIHSRSLALQSFLLDNRMVLNFSRRWDTVRSQSITGVTWPTTSLGGPEFLDKVWSSYDLEGANRTETNSRSKWRDNKGIVVHPLKWLSLHYSDMANTAITGLRRYSYDGSEIPLNDGSSKDYGFTVRLNNRLSIRLNKYTNTQVGIQGSTLGLANNVGAAVNGGGGNSIRDDLPAIDQAALQAGAPIDPKWAVFENFLLTVPWVDENIPASANTSGILPAGGTLRDTMDFIVDRQAKGYDLTIVGNPTPQWRLSLSANKNATRESNLAPTYFEFINDRLPVWAQYASNPNAVTYHSVGQVGTPGTGSNPALNSADGVQTLGELLQAAIGNFYYIQKSAGQLVVSDRKYRVTLQSTYSFREGWLKGSRFGATYVWRSPAAIANTPITVTDNPYIVPGLTSSTLTLADPSNPIRGNSLVSFDVQAGYARRLFHNKITWDIQLNVRNVLNKDDPLAQRALSTGQPVVYSLPAPRTFILTNTISF